MAVPSLSWVVSGAIIAASLGYWFWDFLKSLEPRTRRPFIVAASMYVGGALGKQALGGLWLSTGHNQRVFYMALATGEETLEMLGAAYFLVVTLQYLLSARVSAHARASLRSAA